ncbi:hypothetical protein [Nocardiopsis alba]|uniref:hypothetical protein n=1 Tax=Nocardiopsis alba TaxID=53437 RepID=UPI0035D6EC1B
MFPIDDFLPARYTDHERFDVRARFPRRLKALAFETPLVAQPPNAEAGSDTKESPFLNEEAMT